MMEAVDRERAGVLAAVGRLVGPAATLEGPKGFATLQPTPGTIDERLDAVEGRLRGMVEVNGIIKLLGDRPRQNEGT
jgi:hypothetical protein